MKSKEFDKAVEFLKKLGYSVDLLTVKEIIKLYNKEKGLNK